MSEYGLCGKIVATPGNGDKLGGYLLDAAVCLVINHGFLQMTLISTRGPGTASSVVPMADHAGQGTLK